MATTKKRPVLDYRAELDRLGLMGSNETSVWGPPGCGKTSALCKYARSAIRAYGPDKIVINSMTNAAKYEVRSRDVPVENLEKQVRTTHSLAYEALSYPQLSETAEQIAEWNAWVTKKGAIFCQRSIPQNKYKPEQVGGAERWEGVETGPSIKDGDLLFNQYALSRSRMEPVDNLSRDAYRFAMLWESWKHGGFEEREEWGPYDLPQVLDWEDIIYYASTMTEHCPGTPMALFGDECQDWSRLEWTLIRMWAQNTRRLVTHGDPDQAIMAFAGADAAAFYNEHAQQIHLEQSYRVPAKPQALALKWIREIEDRQDQVYNPREGDEGAVYRTKGTWQQPDHILNLIEKDLANDKTVLVLASCSYMLAPAISSARSRGIPFANPYRPSNRSWNPLAELKGVRTADRILSLHYADYNTWPELLDPAASETWPDDWYLPKWGELRNFVPWLNSDVFAYRGAKSDLQNMLEDQPDHERVSLEALTHWIPAETVSLWSGDSKALLAWFQQNILPSHQDAVEYPIKVALKFGTQALKLGNRPKLRFSTIHAAKGTEADCVYIFPDLSPQGIKEREVYQSPGWCAIQRLYYVAFTRTRHTLVLCSASGRDGVYK